MGLWVYHTFVRTTDIALLERAVQQVLSLDSYEPISKQTYEEYLGRKTSRYGEQVLQTGKLCGVLIIPMTSRDRGWSYIKCVPYSLLSERPQGTAHPRLAELAKILQVDAFRLEVEDGDSAVLLECSSDGKFRVSGVLTSMLDEAYGNYTTEEFEEIEELSAKYFEEEVQADEPAFEILNDLKEFSPVNFDCSETAACRIEAEFFNSLNCDLNDDLAWIYHQNDMFYTEPGDASESPICALYFCQRGGQYNRVFY